MSVALLLLAALVTLVASAFCSGAETGFLSVSRERILHLARAGGRKARKVERALSDMGRTTTTILIGNNLANVAYSSATTALAAELFGANETFREIWSFFAAFLVLYTAEFLPKLLFAARPLRRTLALANTYAVVARILSPLTVLALWMTNVFVPAREEKYKLTSADLLRILQDRKDGVCLSDFESALISRLIVLRVKNKQITSDAILSALRDYE